MTTIGDGVGKSGGGFSDLGVGAQIAPQDIPDIIPVTYASFLGGVDVSDSPEDVRMDAAVLAVNMEVDRDDSLYMSPGIALVQSLGGRVGQWIFQQPGMDYSSELVIVDPPFIGYKDSNAVFTFGNAGIAAANIAAFPPGITYITVAGTGLFSNGVTGTYTRAKGAVVVTDITAQIIAAQCFGLQFGRVFAGGTTPAAGTYQALGIQWNGSSGDPADWTGLNSGAQLLIGAETGDDKVLALIPIGFDALAVLCRRSIWIGLPTGIANAPAAFSPRIMSIGCVNGATAVATPFGVLFLSNSGVIAFDGNNAKVISEEINDLILPLNYAALDHYRAWYNPTLNRYILVVGSAGAVGTNNVWTYTFPVGNQTKGRWTGRSMYIDTFVGWTEPASVSGNPGADSSEVMYATFTNLFGKESPAVNSAFGVPLQSSIWQTPVASRQTLTEQYTTVGYEIEYNATAAALITLQTMNSLGVPTGGSVSKVLPATTSLQRALVWNTSTGMGAALQVTLVRSGAWTDASLFNVQRIRQLVRESGPSLRSI